MIESDKQDFAALMNAASERYAKPKLSGDGLNLDFHCLHEFTYSQVQTAMYKHLRDPDRGRWMPKVADLIYQMEGDKISPDEVLAAARLKNTPFGILCRMQISSWELDNQTDPFRLKQRAEECVDLLPRWQARAGRGEYTDHELSIMLKHDVDPCGPFRNGLSRPQAAHEIENRVLAIRDTPRHLKLISGDSTKSDDDGKINKEGAMRVMDTILKIVSESKK